MSSDKETIAKGIKYLAGSIAFIFAGPVGYMAATAKESTFWIIFSIGLMATAAVLATLGLRLMLKGFFTKPKKQNDQSV